MALTVLLFVFAACADDPPPPAPREIAATPTPAAGAAAQATPPPTVGVAHSVGISMPTHYLPRWSRDGENLEFRLQGMGMDVNLQFADDSVVTQIAQIQSMIDANVDVLIIVAIEGDSLTEVLEGAEAAGIPVISYDRLIMNSSAVTYYATFDNWMVGEMQGQFIADTLDLANQAGPFYIEFFTGDPGDNNINFFFPGAMSILQPFLDDGTLVSVSGQTDIMEVATVGWSADLAQARMTSLIESHNFTPNGQRLDAVLASNDSTAQGVTNALIAAGFTPENIPVITGQDCDLTSVRNMLAGYQAMSVFKDTRTLAENVVEMVLDLRDGRTVSINNTTDYDNGTGLIPTNLSVPVVVTIDNYREILINSGYYTEDQIIHG